MKKTYMIPEIEVVDIKLQLPLLAGSDLSLIDDSNARDPENLLAPGLSIPGLPSFVFE